MSSPYSFEKLFFSINANSVLYTSYFVDVPNLAQNSGTISMIAYLPILGAIFLVNPLVEKFGKKKSSEVPLIAGIVAGFAMAFIPFGHGVLGLVAWLICNTIVSCSVAVLSMLGWAMIADCIDYQELKTGRREEGTVYAIYSLGRKFAQGIGASVVLLIMGWIGCQSAAGEVSINQTPGVANNVRIMIGLIYGICCLAQYLSIKFVYNLDKETVADMQVKLGRVNEVDVFAQQED
jgi:GPH family glycoside/pentoside/hexuronide:cation symporter